jgi:ATP-dependent DNA helicase RecG
VLDLYTPGRLPTFKEGDVFEMIIPIEGDIMEGTRQNTSVNTREKGSEKSSEKSSEKIMRLLKEDKNRSAKDLSALIGISDRAIEKQLAKLQEQEKLQRIGPDKGGY